MKKVYKLKDSNETIDIKKACRKDVAVSTDNLKMKISTLDSGKGKGNKSQIKISAKSTKNGQNKEIIEEEEKDNLTLLREKTALLESDLNKLKSDINMERNNSIQDSNYLNLKITEVNNELNRLIVDNRYLTNNFNSLQKNLSSKLEKIMHKRFRNKTNENENTEEKINKEVKLKDKMILNIKQNLKYFKKEKKFLENELNRNTKKENLEKKLEELKMIQEKEDKEVEELRQIKVEHNKVCTKKISELLKQYDIIQKEYQYEVKKNKKNMNSRNNKFNNNHKIQNKSLKNINIKNISLLDENKINNNNKQCISDRKANNKGSFFKNRINDPKNIYDYYFKQLSENKNRKENLSNSNDHAFVNYNNIEMPITPLIPLTNNMSNNESNISIVKDNINNNRSYSISKTLFTKSERQFLEKIIPNQFLDNYEHKFETIKNENNITIMNENIKEKMLNKDNNILRIENNELQNNITLRKKLILNSKLMEFNKKKREINEKIKSNKKLLEYNKLMYKQKNEKFEKLLKEYQMIYGNIRNGKLFLKKGAQLTQENISTMAKYGLSGKDNISIDTNDEVDYANCSEGDNEEIENENENEDEENKMIN